jgi:hypothetical protein
METVKHWAVNVILPLAVIFALEFVYRDTLFEKTLIDIPLMQAKTKLRPLM